MTTTERAGTRDRHTFKAEFRVVDGSRGRQFWSMPLAYDVVDDYGTLWTRSVFDQSIGEKFPALMWGHSGWTDIAQMMGGAIDYRDTNGGPEVLYELLPEADQPNTRILAALMAQRGSGPPFVRDMSVGFDRWTWEGGRVGEGRQGELRDADREMRDKRGRPAIERILTAGWDESSVVVAGAVPGAKALEGARMVQVRTTAGDVMVPRDTVVDLARQVSEGELTYEQARTALDLAAGVEPPAPEGDEETESIDVDEALAEADEALADLD